MDFILFFSRFSLPRTRPLKQWQYFTLLYFTLFTTPFVHHIHEYILVTTTKNTKLTSLNIYGFTRFPYKLFVPRIRGNQHRLQHLTWFPTVYTTMQLKLTRDQELRAFEKCRSTAESILHQTLSSVVSFVKGIE